MECYGKFKRKAVVLFLGVLIVSLLPGWCNGEIPSKPVSGVTGGVTVLPPVKPDSGPQAFPNDVKSNLPVFTMNYARVQLPFEITLWVLLASFAKIGEQRTHLFKHTPLTPSKNMTTISASCHCEKVCHFTCA